MKDDFRTFLWFYVFVYRSANIYEATIANDFWPQLICNINTIAFEWPVAGGVSSMSWFNVLFSVKWVSNFVLVGNINMLHYLRFAWLNRQSVTHTLLSIALLLLSPALRLFIKMPLSAVTDEVITTPKLRSCSEALFLPIQTFAGLSDIYELSFCPLTSKYRPV